MLALVLALLVGAGQFGQSNSGELRITVRDCGGLAVECRVMLVSEANDFSQQLDTRADGVAIAKRLPFGRYRVAITEPGFAPYDGRVEIDSALPRQVSITLTPAPIQAQVTVRADDTLLDPHQTSAINKVGAETLQQRITTLPGRSLADVVNTEPGWLLEANGILHPRGSEYQGQYVVDGVDFEAGRVRPSASLDAACSVILFKMGHQQVRVQANVINLTDRLNVINFAGLFSGTALAPPRSFGVRVNVEF